MNSYNSPFETQAKPVLNKNYAEVFNEEDYEGKNNIELESYSRNLHNYLKQLLPQNPFPAALFEKLETRLDGLTSMLERRYAASGVLDRTKAEERLQSISARLDQAPAVLPPTTPKLMIDESPRPLKKRKVPEPAFVASIRKDVDALRDLRRSYQEKEEEEM